MGWVTINGNHVLIGEDDGGGPGRTGSAIIKARREAAAHKSAAKTAAIVKTAGKTAAVPGSKAGSEILYERGRIHGYKDVSNLVAGPAHTKHQIHERLARRDRAIDSGTSFRTQPWWEGYARGARQSTEDWLTHLSKATGGRQTRMFRRLYHLRDKI